MKRQRTGKRKPTPKAKLQQFGRLLSKLRERQQAQAEREFTRAWEAELRIVRRCLRKGSVEAIRAALDKAYAKEIPLIWKRAYKVVYLQAGQAAQGIISDWFSGVAEKSLSPGPGLEWEVKAAWAEEVDTLLRDKGGEDIQRITGNTKDKIMNTISRHREDMTIQDMAPFIETHLEELWPRRAETIARTELGRATNEASHAQAKEINPALEKIWLHSGLSVAGGSRPEHVALDGKRVKMGEPFIVGGEKMMYPHDRNASGKNTINCGCTVAYDYPLKTKKLPPITNGMLNGEVKIGMHVRYAAFFGRTSSGVVKGKAPKQFQEGYDAPEQAGTRFVVAPDDGPADRYERKEIEEYGGLIVPAHRMEKF